MQDLDQRTRLTISSIIPLIGYTADQAFSILRSRPDQALAKWVFKESTLRKIAERSKGNMALALNILKACALQAEAQRRKGAGLLPGALSVME